MGVTTKMKKGITAMLAVFLLLLLASTATASKCAMLRENTTGDVHFSKVTQNSATVTFVWAITDSNTADFNYQTISATVNGASWLADTNVGKSVRSFGVGTIAPGDTVTVYVRLYDTNGTVDMNTYCSIDYNATWKDGTLLQSGQYMFFNIFATFGSMFIMLAMMIVGIAALALVGWKVFGKHK